MKKFKIDFDVAFLATLVLVAIFATATLVYPKNEGITNGLYISFVLAFMAYFGMSGSRNK